MMLSKLKSVIKTPEIEFLCEEEDYGVIPAPYPARKNMPNWYKALPGKIYNQQVNADSLDKFVLPTIKRCPPFLDALCIGWIIPLAADVYFKSNFDGSFVEYKTTFHKSLVENHYSFQITSSESPNPADPKPPLKWYNYWYIKVPKDYSVLFVQPLNRDENRFTCYSGLVDCDDDFYEYINFPFFFNIKNFTGVIEAGTPLMQVIPIKRSTLIDKGKINKVDENYKKNIEKHRKRYGVSNSMYRNFKWVRK